jgi:hypothetical protein
VSSRPDRASRGRDAARHEAGTSVAIGAAIGGLAALVWTLWRKKKTLGEEDSPIIIKSGSLSLAIRDDANGKIVRQDDQYQVSSDDLSRKTIWDVYVAELAAGYPWKTPTPCANVTKVVLDIVDDDLMPLDTITMTFENGVLTVKATSDRKFGTKTKVIEPKQSKSKSHKMRAISKDVSNKKDFEIASITVEHAAGSPVFGPGFDYALKFTFR